MLGRNVRCSHDVLILERNQNRRSGSALMNFDGRAAGNEADEVSIGHAIICDALYMGLEKTIQAYLSKIKIF